MYAQAELRNSFARYYRALTKQRIAETIANHIPALNLYVPPARKPWMSEHERMGLFEAAALAWMHFHNSNRRLRACEKRGCLSDHHECGRLLEIGSIP